MSCPDWGALVRERDAGATGESERLDAALEHLAGCRDCRRAALAADPLLVFRRNARAERAGAEAAGSVRAMQDSVLALVRASRVAPATRPERRRNGFRVAASLALLSLLSLAGGPRGTEQPTAARQTASALDSWIDDTALSAEVAPPAVEELERLDARIYEMPQKDFAVVMIVDSSLDV